MSCNWPRVMSPRPGISTLITSAPIQAKSCVAVGAAWTCPRSTMRTPSRALLIFVSSVACRVEKIAVRFDMAGEAQRVLARQPLGEIGVAPFERLDYAHVIGNRARRPVFLVDRDLANRPHMDEQVFGHLGEQRAAAHFYNRLVKRDVRIGVLVEPFAAVSMTEFVHQAVPLGDLGIRGAL